MLKIRFFAVLVCFLVFLEAISLLGNRLWGNQVLATSNCANNDPRFLSPICQHQEKVEKSPTRLQVPSLNIDLPIALSKFKNGRWNVSPGGVSFAQNTAIPGEKGNTVLFFPAKREFDIHEGDLIFLRTDDERVAYKVEKTFLADPSDTIVLAQSDQYELTLVSIGSSKDLRRFVVKGFLVK
ncbi:MAG: sortase [Candidatus Blackburnbacteria bacterium]|nr:sortase [Candidatus Blackburnbacteria bacterium]